MRSVLIFLTVLMSAKAYAEPLFHFDVATKWTYQMRGSSSPTVTNFVSEVRTINGKNWYKLTEYGETFWVRNSDEGQVEAINFFEGNPQQLEKPDERLVFKYPAKVGETWTSAGSPTTYQGVTTVTVPAGTFECHVYLIDMGNNSYSRSCIAVDVGVVYNEAVFDGGAKEISVLLLHEQ